MMIKGSIKKMVRTQVLIISLILKTSSASHETLGKEECDKHHNSLLNDFSWIDYTVLVVMLIISCLIGTFYGFCTNKQETRQDFLLGGSSMGTLPMAMSLAASFITAIELLGNPAEMYTQGTQFWMICLAFILIVPITSQLYLPVYMKLRLTSSYEYLNLRFNCYCRLLASGLYMLQMIFYTSVAVYAPALALSHVTTLNTYVAVSLVYIVCIFYASQGGMKAVIMTDTFQAAVLVLSLLLIVGLGINKAGGVLTIWKDSWDTRRIEFFNMDPNPTVRHSFWSVTIGGTFYWATMFCSNQASIQKYLSVKSIKQARTALWFSALALIMIYTINFITGMVIYTVNKYCDPLKAGYIDKIDQLFPLYVMNYMGEYHGIPGIFVAGIFAASLGTVASALNSLAAITCEDILQGLLKIQVPTDKGAAYARWISIFFGVLSFAFIFIVKNLGGVLQVALSFNGMVGGITLGMFSLGLFIPWSNAKGAMIGAITALALVFWIFLGAQGVSNGPNNIENKETSIESCPCIFGTTSTEKKIDFSDDSEVWSIYRISYLWYSPIGCIITIVMGTIISLITGPQNPADLDSNLLSPPIQYFMNINKNKSPKNNNIHGISNLTLEMDADNFNSGIAKGPR